MKTFLATTLALSFILILGTAPSADAKHHRHSHVGISFGVYPQYPVYTPFYAAPVPFYYQPAPVYQPVPHRVCNYDFWGRPFNCYTTWW